MPITPKGPEVLSGHPGPASSTHIMSHSHKSDCIAVPLQVILLSLYLQLRPRHYILVKVSLSILYIPAGSSSTPSDSICIAKAEGGPYVLRALALAPEGSRHEELSE